MLAFNENIFNMCKYNHIALQNKEIYKVKKIDR